MKSNINNNLNVDITELVESIGHQVPLLEAHRSGIEMYGAPRFSSFYLFNPNENTLSRIFADIFDPKGTHGQGALFLNALLVALNCPRVGYRDVVRVQREVITHERRRIDLVIETPHVLLGIENKPWASQQPNQLSAYIEALADRSNGKQVVLVFLSDQVEKSARGKVARLPYFSMDSEFSLQKLLSGTLESIRAPKIKGHISDFVDYIELHFGGGTVGEESDEPFINAVQAEFDGGVNKRKALAAILLAQERIHAQIIDEIGGHLREVVLGTLGSKYKIVSNSRLSACLQKRWERWSIINTMWPLNCELSIESDKGGYEGIYFGIRAPDPSNIKIKAEGLPGCVARPSLEDLARKVAGGRKTAGWPWWQHPDSRYWGPSFSARLVLESPTGKVAQHPDVQELAKKMVLLAEAVDEILSTN